jgi:hypothetical protein
VDGVDEQVVTTFAAITEGLVQPCNGDPREGECPYKRGVRKEGVDGVAEAPEEKGTGASNG